MSCHEFVFVKESLSRNVTKKPRSVPQGEAESREVRPISKHLSKTAATSSFLSSFRHVMPRFLASLFAILVAQIPSS
jgi:hypothetical protein